jgi:nucleoside-diphosphate-sugar epimerase
MRPSARKLKLAGDPMQVMVLGATGFIGPPLVRALAAMDHGVVAVSRRPAPEPTAANVVGLVVDRADPEAVAAAAQRHGVEAVIDLLAMTLGATQPLLDRLAGRVGRYVMASSADVYQRYDALHRRASYDGSRAPLDEAAPLRSTLYPYRATPRRPAAAPDAWMDDYDKIPVEQAVRDQTGLAGVVVRLPMVYGPGDRQRRFGWAIRPMLANAPQLEVDSRWTAWRTSYGYVDDVAWGLALAATHPAAAGTYNLGPADAPDHAQWGRRFAAALGWPGDIRTVDRSALPPATRAALDGLDLAVPMVTDTTRIRAELSYAETADPAEALARTIADEARHLRVAS